MRRIPVPKRPNSNRLVQSQGLLFSEDPPVSPGRHEPYWPDDRYYSFSTEEIELLKQVTSDGYDMCREAAKHLIEHPDIMTDKMGIPPFCIDAIIESFNRDPAFGSVYARFDVCFGGLDNPDPRLRVPKIYEVNADTPTSMLESSVIQWLWLEQTGHGNDQFNRLTEDLTRAWKRNLTIIEAKLGQKVKVHFATMMDDPDREEYLNTMVLAEACKAAGWEAKSLWVQDIALGPDGRFYDSDLEHLDVVFKLYPWEYLVEDAFGEKCFQDMLRPDGKGTIWIEAPYKMMWSNKIIWAVIWQLFKDDPRSKWLLPTYLESEAPASLTEFARKPVLARVGADIRLQADDQVIHSEFEGGYGDQEHVLQELAMLPEFKDEDGIVHYPCIGIWFVDGKPAGLSIREDRSPVTGMMDSVVPHSISDGPIGYERRPIPDFEEIDAALTADKLLETRAYSNPKVLEYIQRVIGEVASSSSGDKVG